MEKLILSFSLIFICSFIYAQDETDHKSGWNYEGLFVNIGARAVFPFYPQENLKMNATGVNLTAVIGKNTFPVKGMYEFSLIIRDDEYRPKSFISYKGHEALKESYISNRLQSHDFGVRIMPNWMNFRCVPFLDLQTGFVHHYSQLHSDYTYEYRSLFTTEEKTEYKSSRFHSDWSTNYGIGGGISFKLFGDYLPFIQIQIKAMYKIICDANYMILKENATENPDNLIGRYEEENNNLDFISLSIGCSVGLW